MYIGPYTVSFREYDKKYVAISDFKKKKYILSGYNRLGGTQTIYPLGEASIPYIRPNKVNEKHIDVIDDETLLESFKEMLDSEVLSNGKLDLSDTEKVVGFLGAVIREIERMQVSIDTVIKRRSSYNNVSNTSYMHSSYCIFQRAENSLIRNKQKSCYTVGI